MEPGSRRHGSGDVERQERTGRRSCGAGQREGEVRPAQAPGSVSRAADGDCRGDAAGARRGRYRFWARDWERPHCGQCFSNAYTPPLRGVDAAIRAYVRPRVRWLTDLAYRKVRLAVCVSAGLVGPVRALGVVEKDIKVVYNGIEFDSLLARSKQPPSITIPEGDYIVGVGRLSGQKGFDVLIKAHAKALANGAPVHKLIILGDGPDRAELEAVAQEAGVTSSVQFPGFVSNPHPVTARASAFVLSSRWEGFSLGLAEAICLETPSIATNCVSGPSEVLLDGAYGALVPVDDVGAMAAEITSHLLNPEPLRQKARAGSMSCKDRFEPGRAAEQHLGLLRALV
jgi:glycosyltransferase involved in cell wall biosynthesis